MKCWMRRIRECISWISREAITRNERHVLRIHAAASAYTSSSGEQDTRTSLDFQREFVYLTSCMRVDGESKAVATSHWRHGGLA